MAASEPIVAYRKTVMGSNRVFGLVIAAFFAIVALLPTVHGALPRPWALVIAGASAAAAIFFPRILHPLNRFWFALGLLLHNIVNPLVMSVMFFGAILPMGLLLRALGKDLLRLKHEPGASSYWIPRDPPGPITGSMNKQF